jgi:hypothetical protein
MVSTIRRHRAHSSMKVIVGSSLDRPDDDYSILLIVLPLVLVVVVESYLLLLAFYIHGGHVLLFCCCGGGGGGDSGGGGSGVGRPLPLDPKFRVIFDGGVLDTSWSIVQN